MRILFFTSLKAVHARKWLAALAPLHDVHVATFWYSAADEIPGVTIHAVQGKHTRVQTHLYAQGVPSIRRDAWLTLRIGDRFARRLGAIVDSVQPDLVHAHQSVPFGWYAHRALTQSRVRPPLIVSVWGTDVIGYPQRTWLYRWLNRRVLGPADVITATGTYLAEQASHWTTKDSPIEVVPFGVDTSLFVRKQTAPSQARVFGMAKMLRPHMYGIDLAIRALAHAREQRSDVRLEIAGDGPDKEHLGQLARELGVSEAIRWLGRVSQAALPATFARWDAYLLPSRAESFGISALEAQAVGLPILAARTGGIPEVVSKSTTTFVEPLTAQGLGEAMLALGSNPARLKQAWQEGPPFVAKHFEWRQCVARMHHLYERIAAQTPRR